jgi:hypothetical protein
VILARSFGKGNGWYDSTRLFCSASGWRAYRFTYILTCYAHLLLPQVEEEEYTSRIIQHFSAGLLTLPEGATLRSYLADKLNCDPMRITKKFTGACCLGKRVYNLRDRPQASHGVETEMAKAEVDHLEKRFRTMLVEQHGQQQSGGGGGGGVHPLASSSRRQEMLLAEPPAGVNTIYHPIQQKNAAASCWLQSLAAAAAPMSANTPSMPLNSAGGNLARGRGTPRTNATNNNGWSSFAGTTAPLAAGHHQQWLLQNSGEAAFSSAPPAP